MTRTAIRHTLLSVAIAAMLSPLAPCGSIVLAGDGKLDVTISLGYDERGSKQKPKGLATQKGRQQSPGSGSAGTGSPMFGGSSAGKF